MSTIDLTSLDLLLARTCAHALFVPARVLRRVIKRDRQVAIVGLQVPHEDCYAVTRDIFERHVERREVSRWPPDEATWLLLLPTPDPSQLNELPRAEVLSRLWRLLFHARMDQELRQAIADERLTAATVRQRIERVGHGEFGEIRALLREEELLLPPADDVEAYVEFVALFFELRFFAPELIPDYFPSLDFPDAVAGLLAEDLDPAALFAATRPPNAEARLATLAAHAATIEFTDQQLATASGELHAENELQQAQRVGNLVRAAVIRARRSAPSGGSGGTQEIAALAVALHAALGEGTPAAEDWRDALQPVLAALAGGRLSPEVRFLLDLQRVAVEHARPAFAVDLWGWARSLGRQPLQRALPARRRLWMTRRLQRAERRLGDLRLSAAARDQLAELLARALLVAEAGVRTDFRARLLEALDEAGARPSSRAEEIARDKLVEELLDRMFQRGFLSMGELRDALSRNQLKLGDLGSIAELAHGDALLRLDSRLGASLEGVHRRGEVYLRGLQRGSALAFGTRPGRWLTRYVALPFGGAYVVLEGLQHILGPLVRYLGGPAIHLRSWGSVLGVGLFLLGLLHVPVFRAGVMRALELTRAVLVGVCLDFPAWLWRRSWLVWLRTTGVWRWTRRLLVRPVLPAAALWWIVPTLGASATTSVIAGVTLFLGANVVLNSSIGRTVEEVAVDLAARTWRRLRHRIIPGLLGWVVQAFKRLVDQLERALYTVDEWLLFRHGQHRGLLVGKAAAGLVWGTIRYVVRLYVTLLIEPQVNPIKHFPVVTVSHKIILPFSLTLTGIAARPLEPVLGVVLANTIAGATVFLLPGVFGFLVWELKENWRLYAANRSKHLRPAVVGSHGETIARLLRPGFHSGTIPKIFARVRKAERGRRRRRDQHALAKARADLHHVAMDVRRFVEREFIALLHRLAPVAVLQLSVSRVVLSASRLRVELRTAGQAVAVLAIEEQAGWLIASWSREGFVRDLDETQRAAFRGALVGLYQLAGVALVREHVRQLLPPSWRYDVDAQGLVVWRSGDLTQIRYPLRGRRPERPLESIPAIDLPISLRDASLHCDHARVPWALWERFCEGTSDEVLAPACVVLTAPTTR